MTKHHPCLPPSPTLPHKGGGSRKPPVILFPAIDLKDGACVRLQQGDMARETVFNSDPAAPAKAVEAQGFEYLHVVDLDGAFAGKPGNAGAGEKILQGTK